jgi:23S rRNA pseudouridine2604 synthase
MSLRRVLQLWVLNLLQVGSFLFLSKYHKSPFRIHLSERSSQDGVEGVRLNKVFQATHSRRKADALIISGRVTVNGVCVAASPGVRVTADDIIELDGKRVEWMMEQERYDYIKYWKPTGVVCTTDRRIRENVLDAIEQSPTPQKLPDTRIFPVGRLDKDTSGLIILTSDGRVPNSVLRGSQKQPKTYEVEVNRPLNERVIEELQQGVVITTQAQRDGHRPAPLTARTLPCQARQLSSHSLSLTIVEGRNRQIRKMLEAVGYQVENLHRTEFMGIDLSELPGPRHWKSLSFSEQSQIEEAIRNALHDEYVTE